MKSNAVAGDISAASSMCRAVYGRVLFVSGLCGAVASVGIDIGKAASAVVPGGPRRC